MRPGKTYTILQAGSAIFMILALLWLTMSLPFVYGAQQENNKHDKVSTSSSSGIAGNEEESANPFGNNTEEKCPNSTNSLSEEYLHDHHADSHFFSIALQYHKCENAGTYIAFHGELLVPPPNVA